MGLRDIEFTLPPGFRFHPSDEELLCHYLYRKVTDGASTEGSTMVEVDLHAREPWELPDAAKLGANEWYFFSFRDRKYATGSRTNRATRSGYWKATGKDRAIYDPSTRAMVGLRKTLVFYTGRAPHGAKTNWVMHEFRLETPHSPPKEDWVLCRVFHKTKGEAQEHGYKPGSYSPNNVPDHHMNSTHLTRREEEEEEDYFSSSPLLDMCSARDFPQMGMGMGMASTPLMECGDHDEFAFLFDLGLEQGFRLPRWQQD